MSDTRIEKGDSVRVEFSTHGPVIGVVLHKPQATGDSWILRTGDMRDDIIYIQQFDFMFRIDKLQICVSEDSLK